MISKYAFLLLILHSLSSEVLARRSTLKIENDRRAAFLVEPFCFAEGGYLDLQVRTIYSLDDMEILFFQISIFFG
jgi:hypothetical protein